MKGGRLSKKSTHGGKRSGAGAPRVVDYLERIAIGAEVENRLNDVAQSEAIERIKQKRLKLAIKSQNVGQADAEKLLSRIEEIHAELVMLGPPKRRRETKLADRDESERIGDVRENIAATGGAFFSEPLMRPKGSRGKIIARVAEWASQKYALSIKPSFVEDCLKEYRAFLREIAAELEFPPK